MIGISVHKMSQKKNKTHNPLIIIDWNTASGFSTSAIWSDRFEIFNTLAGYNSKNVAFDVINSKESV